MSANATTHEAHTGRLNLYISKGTYQTYKGGKEKEYKNIWGWILKLSEMIFLKVSKNMNSLHIIVTPDLHFSE